MRFTANLPDGGASTLSGLQKIGASRHKKHAIKAKTPAISDEDFLNS